MKVVFFIGVRSVRNDKYFLLFSLSVADSISSSFLNFAPKIEPLKILENREFRSGKGVITEIYPESFYNSN